MKHEKGALMDPLTELSMSKAAELFTEGIPAVIIQVAAAVFRGNSSQMELLSLAISLVVCGFTSAQNSYDFDTDPVKRAQKPDFYGYVPDGSSARAICYSSLIAISSFMLIIKTLGLVLLSAVALDYIIYVFAFDIGSYLSIKIISGDFIYWPPLEGITSILMSLLSRVIVKVITDFTSVVQLRHPNEVGAAQWVFGQIISVTTLFIALHLAEASEKLVYEMSRLWSISYILTAAALFSYFVFFSNINKGYIHTFFSFETGGQATIRNFRAHEDDGLKADIFSNNKNQWKSIYEEVKEWVWQNWPKWMEEKPAWFDDRMRSTIPQDMIPSSDDQKQIAAERGKDAVVKSTQSSGGRRTSQSRGRRRSSFEDQFRGIFLDDKKKSSKIVPVGGGELMTEEIAGEFMKMSRERRGTMSM